MVLSQNPWWYDNLTTNKVTISGEVSEVDLHYSFKANLGWLGRFFLIVKRISGKEDHIPVVMLTRFLTSEELIDGQKVKIQGKIISQNKRGEGDGKFHRVFIFGERIYYYNKTDAFPEREEVNKVHIFGCVSREPNYKVKRSGQRIFEFMVCVNGGPYFTPSYIPIILWDKTAEWARDTITVHTPVDIRGRIQSRYYVKVEDDQRKLVEVYDVSSWTVNIMRRN